MWRELNYYKNFIIFSPLYHYIIISFHPNSITIQITHQNIYTMHAYKQKCIFIAQFPFFPQNKKQTNKNAILLQ